MIQMKQHNDNDPEIIYSKHSGPFERDGHLVQVVICKLAKGTEWSLEVVDKHGSSTVWENTFPTDAEAWKTFTVAVEEEGIEAIIEGIESILEDNEKQTIH